MSEILHLPLGTPQPVAKVRGELMMQLPADLYVPPDALEVFLDAFEGPLDLLLYLIRKANVDILDIPMASLTLQYLEYVEAMRTRNLELAAEYLVMAAMQMKAAAREIDALPQRDRDFLAVTVWMEQAAAKRLPQVDPHALIDAWRELLKQARMREHHHITREELSVREYMAIILRELRSGEFRPFIELFVPARGVSFLVVNFLAVLELAREGLIEISQSQPYAPIYVKSCHAEHA